MSTSDSHYAKVQNDDTPHEEEKKEKAPEQASVKALFQYLEGVDWLVFLVGMFAAMATGCGMPMFVFLF